MSSIDLTKELKKIAETVETFTKKEVPFAVANALTSVAKEIQAEVRKELDKEFTIRNPKTQRFVAFERAEKKDWPNMKATVGITKAFLASHFRGKDRQPHQRNQLGKFGVAITGNSIRPTIPTVILPSKRVQRLAKRHGAGITAKGKNRFIIEAKSPKGRDYLLERHSSSEGKGLGDRSSTEVLYSMEDRAHIDKTFDLDKIAEKVIDKYIDDILAKELDKSFKKIFN